jgi:hypothetical protein
MVHDLFFYALLLMGILWLSVILMWVWPPPHAAPDRTDRQPTPRAPKRLQDLNPFPGLTHKPCCVACEQAAQASAVQSPPTPPRPLTSMRGRRRHVDTSVHFCPNPHCEYRGWVGLGNLCANGHPRGAPGGSGTASSAGATSSKPTGPPFTASVGLPSAWYGQ